MQTGKVSSPAMDAGAGSEHGANPHLWRALVAAAVAVFVLALADALLHPRAAFDLPLMLAIQGIDLPGLPAYLETIDDLTGSRGAVAMWALLVLAFAAARSWLSSLALLALPVAGLVNEVISRFLIDRPRPRTPELARHSLTLEGASFPSGHVVGAVLLYGFLFAAAARLPNRPLRLAVRCVCLTIIATTGFGRVWKGFHWPSDVLAAYALGTVMLAALLVAHGRLAAMPVALSLVPDPERDKRAKLVLAIGAAARPVSVPVSLLRPVSWLVPRGSGSDVSSPDSPPRR